MARKLALLLLALLVALFFWQRSSPEPVPVAISAPHAAPVRAEALEVEATESAVQPSRTEVQPDPDAHASSALPEAEADAEAEIETRLCVRVLARDTHEPCADAWVSASRLPEPCDAQGRIELRTQGPYALRAGAPGYLPACFEGAAGHETSDTALEIELARAASLVVVLEDAPQSGFPSLSVTPDPGSQSCAPSGQGYFDSAGRATLDELPPDVPLRVHVSDGHSKLVDLPDSIALRAGETRELRVRLGDTCRVSGRAFDERGAPVEGLALWLLPASSVPRLLAEPGERGQASASASTDAQGRFVFEGVLPGTWRLAPAVSSRSLDLFTSSVEVAPVVQQVEIPAGSREQTVEYRVQRGYTIRGVVLDPDGRPARGVPVSAQTNPGIELAQCREDGRFELGPFPAGSYELVAGAFTLWASLPVQVEAGARAVVLRLQRLGRIAGHVVDASTRQAVAAQVTLLQPGRERDSDPTIFSEPDGSFEFDGLPPGSYALVATPYDGRIAILRSVEIAAGSEATGLTLMLVRGARLKLRGAGLLRIEQSGLRLGTYRLDADEAQDVSVPAGAVRLVLRAPGGGEEARELTLEAGEEREIAFKTRD
jgi:protocatechuate 3,4-dioxygenase beta subunit